MVGRAYAKGGQVVGNPSGAGLSEFGVGGGGAEGEDPGTGSLTCADAGRGVFYHDAVGGTETENLGGFEVGLGVGLAALNVVGGDHVLWHRQAGGADADLGQAAGAGGRDGPAVRRESLQDFERSGEGDDAFSVFDFAALDLAIFRVMIGVREEVANRGDAGASVSLADDLVGKKAVLVGPDGPDTGYGRSGVDQDAV